LLNDLCGLGSGFLASFNHSDASFASGLLLLRPLLDSLQFFLDGQVFSDKAELQFADSQYRSGFDQAFARQPFSIDECTAFTAEIVYLNAEFRRFKSAMPCAN
jgi:hypothetical protein